MLDAGQARKELEKILNTKEYQVYYNESKGFLQIWWEKAREWLAEQLEKLFPAIESAGNAASSILIGIIVIILLLLGLALFLIIRSTNRKRMLKNKKPLHSLKELNWTFQRHLTEAEKQEALAEYTAATRHLFLALLLYFHEKGWLEARIWKTNWEYYDELRKVNQQSAEQFYDLALFFDEVTYGETNAAEEEYRQFKAGVLNWLGDMESLQELHEERG